MPQSSLQLREDPSVKLISEVNGKKANGFWRTAVMYVSILTGLGGKVESWASIRRISYSQPQCLVSKRPLFWEQLVGPQLLDKACCMGWWFHFLPGGEGGTGEEAAASIPPGCPRAPKRDRSLCSLSPNISDLGQLLYLSPPDAISPTTGQRNGCQEALQPGGCDLGLILEFRVSSIYVAGCFLSAVAS